MLLTAMYSEEEADVTAKKIAESALCLQGKILRSEMIRWVRFRNICCNSESSARPKRSTPRIYLPIKMRSSVAAAPPFPNRATAAL